LAHYGNLSIGVVADVLRKAARRKVWESIHASKELTADVMKAASKIDSIKKRPKDTTPIQVHFKVMPSVSLPSFEMVQDVHKSSKATVPIVYTVLSNVSAKEYYYLTDVFSPDRTPIESLLRCEPVVMDIVAPNEKSFMHYIGEGSNRSLYELVCNIAAVVPTLLITGRREFQEHILPSSAKKKKQSFLTAWTLYNSTFLTIELAESNNDVSSRFIMQYKSKIPTFKRLTTLAKTALLRSDEQMLVACAVRAVYMHLSVNMSEETEAYVIQIVRACVSMYRHSSK
jgi:hypothetical protein